MEKISHIGLALQCIMCLTNYLSISKYIAHYTLLPVRERSNQDVYWYFKQKNSFLAVGMGNAQGRKICIKSLSKQKASLLPNNTDCSAIDSKNEKS